MVGALLSGRYQIKRLCGEGGMGRVYEAEHVEIGKRVAIKVLHPAYSRTPDLVERFRREARAASSIEHPNVVNVTDFGTTADGSLFFVMEYIEGIELGLLIHREGPLATLRVLHIAEQMCEALQAAHDVGVIHRDLKPENILLLGLGGANNRSSTSGTNPGLELREASEFVKVLDFGIAKSAEIEGQPRIRGKRLTRPGVAMGTPEYMAPEQAAGHPADPRSDIYAVGSIMYEMLSGKAPYEGDNVMEVLHKKANEPPPALSSLRPGLPPAMVGLVERAMARAPEERPQSMAELAYEIRAIETSLLMTPPPVLVSATSTSSRDDEEGGIEAVAPEPSRTRIVMPFAARRRLYVAGGIAAALLAATGLFLIGRARRAQEEARGASALTVTASPSVASPVPPPPPLPAVLLDASAEAAPMVAEAGPEPSEPEAEPSEGAKREVGRVARATTSAKEIEESLQQAQQLLHAQRYDEARTAFTKLLAVRPAKGAAASGLAKIAFQEKDYKQAADRARESARAGGGVEARILLGDAYFKLHKFGEAKKAYGEALKLDPNNRVAGQGLRLIEGQAGVP